MTDRRATQRFIVLNVLTENCGKLLTPENVDKITKEFEYEMKEGSCAWAFKEIKNERK